MGKVNRLRILLAGAVVAWTGLAVGQQPSPNGELAAAIEAAKSQFRPATPAQVEAARTKLAADVARLDRSLSKGSNGQAWRKFLMWEELHVADGPRCHGRRPGFGKHPLPVRQPASGFGAVAVHGGA